jgi:hypothetical protein
MPKNVVRSRYSLNGRLGLGMCLAALIILPMSDLSTAQEIAGGRAAKAPSQTKKQVIQKVKAAPSLPTSFENFDGVPLLINEASVKEITDADYYHLTGLSKGAARYTTFPSVTLTNNTGQRITGLVLMVGDRQTRRIHGVKLYSISIDPHGSFSVKPEDWVRPEKMVRVSASGKITESSKPGLDSEKMWFPAGVADLILRVGQVEFEDGQRWVIDPRTGSW